MTPSGGKAALSRLTDGASVPAIALVVLIAGIFSAAAWLLSHDAGIVFGALGVLAVLLAAIQFADARSTLGNIETIGEKLEDSAGSLEELRGDLSTSTDRLEEQLSTRQIGVFPNFLPKIVDLLKPATESVVIFCDFPAYGEFSKFEAFREYAEVIEAKGSLVSLLCLDDDARRELTEEQVGKGGGDDWKSSIEGQLRGYLDAHGSPYDFERIQREDLVKMLAEGDTNTLTGEFGAASRWVTTTVMPLYFWIVDGEEAVFSLAPFMQPEALEVGFRTSDAKLIGALKGIFQRYKGMAQTRKFDDVP
jgi:hypothetical protein